VAKPVNEKFQLRHVDGLDTDCCPTPAFHQSANHGDEEVVMYAYGAPPETGGAEFLGSAV
jgi:hypothetical protein